MPSRIQLFSRKAVSREAKDSSRFSAFNSGSRYHKSAAATTIDTTRKPPK